MQSWSLILLCYNESMSIVKIVREATEVLNIISSNNHEIIIVDDGSSDGSTELIKELEYENPIIRVVYHKKNKGIGSALQSGYNIASKENVCVIPADGQFNIKELIKISRLEPKSFISFYRKEYTGYSNFRKSLTLTNRLVNKTFLGVHLKDVNWIKIFNREMILNLRLTMSSSLIESEICSKMIINGFKPIEIESEYLPRENGVSKGGSLIIIYHALIEVLKLIVIIFIYKRNYKNGLLHENNNIEIQDY